MAVVLRLPQFGAPLADNLQAKQVYVANKARAIAGPPFRPLANRLDFLDERGQRLELTEEVPVYTGLLGLGYRLFGEREWLGRLLSLVATLAAIAAFWDLTRREYDEAFARVAALLLACAPLFIFYGRAVLPDPAMLACMLAAAAFYRRHLDGSGRRDYALAALAGLLAGLFKYYGLIVLIPLAQMTWRQAGSWRALAGRRFVGLAILMAGPLALWMALVFARTPNPVLVGWSAGGAVRPYLVVQAPGVLFERALWGAFASRFLLRDCGPVAAGLIGVGGVATLLRRSRPGPVGGWTALALAFFVLLAPKLVDHDYYELMMLPAACTWAALGWRALAGVRWPASGPIRARRRALGAALLAAAVVGQSPWVMGGLFRLDRGKLEAAGRLARACPPGGRVVAIGPGIELPVVVHYSGREGWAIQAKGLDADWPGRFAHYKALGATSAAVYFDPKATAAQRAAYGPLLGAFPVVDRGAGAWGRSGERCEFVILDLESRGDSPRRLGGKPGESTRR